MRWIAQDQGITPIIEKSLKILTSQVFPFHSSHHFVKPKVLDLIEILALFQYLLDSGFKVATLVC